MTVLSKKEEAALFKQLKENPCDKELKEKIVLFNQGLVKKIANRIMGTKFVGILGFEDLEQCGYIGLVKAIEGFDYERNFKFSTYAYMKIYREMDLEIIRNSNTVRFSHRTGEGASRFISTKNDLTDILGRSPSLGEIAEAMGINMQKAFYLRDVASGKFRAMSLEKEFLSDRENFGGKQLSLESVISDDKSGPEELTELKLRREDILKAVKTLRNFKQIEVLILRFGLDGHDGAEKTLEEIGKEMGLTRERIRQIEENAIFKLKCDPFVRKLLQDYRNR